MKIIFSIIIILFFCVLARAQVSLDWTSNIILGSNSPIGFQMDTNENLVLWGKYDTLLPSTSRQSYIAKVDSGGTQLWTKTFPLYIQDTKINSNGDIYLTGTTLPDSVLTKSASLIKLSPEGDLQWQINYSQRTEGNSITIDSIGQPIIQGLKFNDTTGMQFFISKYDQNGNIVWNTQYGDIYDTTNYPERNVLITIDHNQNMYVLDSYYMYNDTSWISVYKFDINGNNLWNKLIPNSYFSSSNKNYYSWNCYNDNENIILDSLDGIYFTYQEFNSPQTICHLTHYSSTGNFLSDLNLGFSSRYIRKSNDGYIYVTGIIAGVNIDTVSLRKINLNDSLIWEIKYPRSAIYDFRLVDDSIIYISFTEDCPFSTSYCTPISFAKCSATGNIEWESSFNDNGFAVYGGHFTFLKIDSQHNIFAVGYLIHGFGAYDGSHTLVQKYHEPLTRINSSSSSTPALNIYPNPSADIWSVTLKNISQIKNTEIEIRDINGCLINSYNYFINGPEIIIKSNGLTPGIYFLRIKTEQWERTEKLVLIR